MLNHQLFCETLNPRCLRHVLNMLLFNSVILHKLLKTTAIYFNIHSAKAFTENLNYLKSCYTHVLKSSLKTLTSNGR